MNIIRAETNHFQWPRQLKRNALTEKALSSVSGVVTFAGFSINQRLNFDNVYIGLECRSVIGEDYFLTRFTTRTAVEVNTENIETQNPAVRVVVPLIVVWRLRVSLGSTYTTSSC